MHHYLINTPRVTNNLLDLKLKLNLSNNLPSVFITLQSSLLEEKGYLKSVKKVMSSRILLIRLQGSEEVPLVKSQHLRIGPSLLEIILLVLSM